MYLFFIFYFLFFGEEGSEFDGSIYHFSVFLSKAEEEGRTNVAEKCNSEKDKERKQ